MSKHGGSKARGHVSVSAKTHRDFNRHLNKNGKDD